MGRVQLYLRKSESLKYCGLKNKLDKIQLYLRKSEYLKSCTQTKYTFDKIKISSPMNNLQTFSILEPSILLVKKNQTGKQC